jgi:hypothetical protein
MLLTRMYHIYIMCINAILGGHFRQVGSALHGSGSVVDRAKFPCHRHPQRNDPGGAIVKVPAVQGLPEGIYFITITIL